MIYMYCENWYFNLRLKGGNMQEELKEFLQTHPKTNFMQKDLDSFRFFY